MSTAEPARSQDPLAIIWLATAARLGLRIVRRPDVYASSDGAGTIALGDAPSLDPDDTLAQMILHEICHWIVAGPVAIHEIDWGFPPTEELHWLEWPTLRLQRALVAPHGLERLLAPTTAGRAYWNRLADPLEPLDDSPQEARIVDETVRALTRAAGAPWGGPLTAALRATAAIRAIVLPVAPPTTTWT